VGVGLALVLLGAGCATSAPVDVSLAAGDEIVIRQTVYGIGGKLTELVGVAQDERTVVVPEAWPDVTSAYGQDTFVFLPKSKYAELVANGKTELSLGLFDESLSDALTWTERVNTLLSLVGEQPAELPSGDDVLTVSVTEAQATDWVRLNGELVQVKTIEAANWFASYKILADADSPLILSLTLKPAARAEFSALSSFAGFEVGEINQAAPPSADQPQP
jgi:hypothetical protein